MTRQNKPPTIHAVEVRAELRQIRTMEDGSANLILNIPEDCREQIKVMLDWLKLEVKAVIAAPDKPEEKEASKYGL